MNDAVEIRVDLVAREPLRVELAQEIELHTLLAGREMGRREVGHRGFLAFRRGAHGRGLIRRGQESAAVVVSAEAIQRIHGDEAGHVAGFRAEAVKHPRAERGPRLQRIAGVDHRHRGLVRLRLRVQAVQDAKMIGLARDVGEQFADPLPAPAVLRELPRAAEKLRVLLRAEQLAVVGVELGFVIERVQVRDPALHEDENDALRSRGKMRRARRQRVRRPFRGPRRERGHGEIAEAADGGAEHLATREVGVERNVHGG